MKNIATTMTAYGMSTAAVTAATENPTAMDSRPAVTTSLVPKRRTSLGDSGAIVPVNTANGSVRTPASSVP